MKGKKFLAFSLAAALLVGGAMSVSAAGVQDVFDADAYAGKYADLKAAYGNDASALLGHFLAAGAKEGRVASDILDVAAYRKAYADLDAAFGDNWDAYVEHYLTYGIKEGRTTGVLFDLADYAAKNPDVKAAYGEDYAAIASHYVNFSKKEGRKGGEIKKAEAPVVVVASGNSGSSNNNNTNTEKPTEGETVAPATHQHWTLAQGATLISQLLPTCTEAGYQELRCNAPVMENVYDANGNWTGTRQKVVNGVPVTCDSVYKVTLAPAHSRPESTDNLYIEHPTCTSTGIMKYTCTKCGKDITETLEALQHDYVQVGYVESKGCRPGDEGQNIFQCKNCGVKTTTSRPLLNHQLGTKRNVEVESTCTAAGKAYGYCDVCGAKVYENLPLKDHNVANTTNVTVYADTYTVNDAANGAARTHAVYKVTYCKDCNLIIGVDDTDAATFVPCVDANHDGACDNCRLQMNRTGKNQIKIYQEGETFIGTVQ